MSSAAVATFNFTNFTARALPPTDTDVGIHSVLRKRVGDTTLSFAFSDASLKDPKGGQGIILGAEANLKGGRYLCIYLMVSSCEINRRTAIHSFPTPYSRLFIDTAIFCRWCKGCLDL